MDIEKARTARKQLEQEKKERDERLKKAFEANERFQRDLMAKNLKRLTYKYKACGSMVR